MLLEGVVAILSLATVMVLSKNDALVSASPDRIYAEGLSRFFGHLGIPVALARSFAMLAFATFIYDTLDVTTRLARQIFQELTGWSGWVGRVAATFVSLLLPWVCVSMKVTDADGVTVPAWKVFWTVFGTSNQLLAALTLMMLSLWLAQMKKAWWVAAIPMLFMMLATFSSLFLLIRARFDAVSAVAVLLLVVAVLLVFEAIRMLRRGMISATNK
jgi:carbon starvation protein